MKVSAKKWKGIQVQTPQLLCHQVYAKKDIQCIILVLKGQTQEKDKKYFKPEAVILFCMYKYAKKSKLYKNSPRKTTPGDRIGLLSLDLQHRFHFSAEGGTDLLTKF